MRYITKTIYLFIALLMFTQTSCTKERYKSEPTTIELETRSFLSSDPDDRVSRLRIMAFDKATGVLKSNKIYNYNSFTEVPSSGGKKFTLTHQMESGDYDFILIANEPEFGSRYELSLRSVSNKSQMSTIYLEPTDFSKDKDIPMLAEVNNVRVLPNNTGVQIGGGATQTLWKIEMIRLAIAVDLHLNSNKTDVAGVFQGVTFSNIVDKLPLIGNYTAAHPGSPGSFNIVKTGFSADTDAEFSGLAWKVTPSARIILPSYLFTPVNTPARGLNLTVDLGRGASNPTVVIGGKTNNYTLQRNTRYRIKGNIDLNRFEVVVIPWTEISVEPEL